MKFLIQILVFTLMFLSLPGVYSQAQTTEPQDPETKEELSTERDEPADTPDSKEISKPKAIYNYFKSHYDGGLVFESKNGNFRIRARTRVQLQFSVTDNDTNSTDTDLFVRRLRLKFDGHAFRPWLKYVLQISRDKINLDRLGETSGIQLKDAYIDAVYFKKIFPRIGQFKVPFNREELNSSSALLLVERSIVNSEFAYARDRGGALYGFLGKHVVYGTSVFIGDGIQGTEEGTATGSNLFAARVQLNFGGELKYSNGSFPSGGDYKLIPDFTKEPVFEIGAAVVGIPDLDISGKTPDSGALVERLSELGIVRGGVASIAADVSYKLPEYNVEAAYLGRWIDPKEGGGETVYDQGLRIQTGVFLVPDLLEAAGRGAFILYDTSPEAVGSQEVLQDTSLELTPGINVYFTKNNNWKLQFSYSYLNNTFTQRAPDLNQKVFRIQFQAYY